MSTEQEATPRPWEVILRDSKKAWRDIYANNKPVVDATSFERHHRHDDTDFYCGVRISKADAYLIVTAVNSFDALRDALEQITEACRNSYRSDASVRDFADRMAEKALAAIENGEQK